MDRFDKVEARYFEEVNSLDRDRKNSSPPSVDYPIHSWEGIVEFSNYLLDYIEFCIYSLFQIIHQMYRNSRRLNSQWLCLQFQDSLW